MNPLSLLPVKEIYAKNGEKILVDGDYDGEYFSEYTWAVLPSGFVILARGRSTYDINERTGESLKNADTNRRAESVTYLHHLVLPPKKGYWVKHINNNRLDNRSCNITYTTPSDNALTRRNEKLRVNKSGYRGVRWHKQSGSWLAYCRHEYLGLFPSREAAARAYDREAKRAFGDKALLNFKEETNGRK